MPLKNVPHVTRSRLKVRMRLPGTNPIQLLSVETDLPLDKNHPDYEAEEIRHLIEAIRQEMPLLGAQEAEIVSSLMGASASTDPACLKI